MTEVKYKVCAVITIYNMFWDLKYVENTNINHDNKNFSNITFSFRRQKPPPTQQAIKMVYSFPPIEAWGPLFMIRDWGHSNITDSEGQRFQGNHYKDCGTMLQEHSLIICQPNCLNSGDLPGIPRNVIKPKKDASFISICVYCLYFIKRILILRSNPRARDDIG